MGNGGASNVRNNGGNSGASNQGGGGSNGGQNDGGDNAGDSAQDGANANDAGHIPPPVPSQNFMLVPALAPGKTAYNTYSLPLNNNGGDASFISPPAPSVDDLLNAGQIHPPLPPSQSSETASAQQQNQNQQESLAAGQNEGGDTADGNAQDEAEVNNAGQIAPPLPLLQSSKPATGGGSTAATSVIILPLNHNNFSRFAKPALISCIERLIGRILAMQNKQGFLRTAVLALSDRANYET